uniref:Ovule protein n=1 Tax=Romanomermis culicivorax TaxID=13658 RepID=A0A915K7F7_ROMCU
MPSISNHSLSRWVICVKERIPVHQKQVLVVTVCAPQATFIFHYSSPPITQPSFSSQCVGVNCLLFSPTFILY